MRDSNTTEYTKIIAITEEHFSFIEETRGKKSKAGRLREIIEAYQEVKEKNEKKNSISKQSSSEGSDVAEYINLFKPINPTINFGNKTTRKAVADLIKQFGKEKATEYALYAVSVFGKPYAPVITTPYDLREKLSKLAAFHTSDKNKTIKTNVAPAYKPK